MRLGFHRRLWVALVLTLLVIGLIQYFVLAHDASNRFYADAAQTQRADAAAVSRAFDITVPGEVPLNNVNRYLRAVQARPGVDNATMVDRTGAVMVAGSVLGIGVKDPDPHVGEVLRSGRPYGGPASGGSGRDVIFVTPVRGVPGGPHALVVRERRSVIDSRLGDLRTMLTILVLGGGLLGIPAFYFLGGRSLGRLHQAAVQRASYDGLTDLPNHSAFHAELERQESLARRHDAPLSLAVLDVDDFRYYNDAHGHTEANRALKAVADALDGGRTEDRPFRTGGDEFALILPAMRADEARVALRNACDRLEATSTVALSGGLAELGPGVEDAESLRDQADAALFAAKRRGGGQIVSFADLEDAKVITAVKVRAVRRLLEGGTVAAAYQPIWNLDGKTLVGYEGLARPSAEFDLAGPGEAFDIAEAIGRSPELDELCRHAILNQAGGLPDDALLFVNVAPQTLDAERLDGDRLVEEASAAGLAPERVVLEITERFTGPAERVISQARRLRELGFKVALDDVGAGNSGLRMLRELELDFVKIDREVVVGAVNDVTARAVLVSIMAFAAQTGSFVIAEGIEDQAMLQIVRDPSLGGEIIPRAHGVQGYLFGRPGALPDGREAPAQEVLGTL